MLAGKIRGMEVVDMDSLQAIASELSYLVKVKRDKELNAPDVPKVKAPAEKPSHFYGDERLHTGIRTQKALR